MLFRDAETHEYPPGNFLTFTLPALSQGWGWICPQPPRPMGQRWPWSVVLGGQEVLALGRRASAGVGSTRYLPRVVHTALLPFSGMAQSWAVRVKVYSLQTCTRGLPSSHTSVSSHPHSTPHFFLAGGASGGPREPAGDLGSFSQHVSTAGPCGQMESLTARRAHDKGSLV